MISKKRILLKTILRITSSTAIELQRLIDNTINRLSVYLEKIVLTLNEPERNT